jgi:hypothetical protein
VRRVRHTVKTFHTACAGNDVPQHVMPVVAVSYTKAPAQVVACLLQSHVPVAVLAHTPSGQGAGVQADCLSPVLLSLLLPLFTWCLPMLLQAPRAAPTRHTARQRCWRHSGHWHLMSRSCSSR